MQAKSRFFLIPVFLTMALLIISSWRAAHPRQAPRGGGQAIPVQTAAAQIGDVSSVNALTGIVTANVQTNVGTKVAGRVQSVYVDMGDRVSAGQVLAQLDTIDLEGQLAQAKAQIQIDLAQIPDAQATVDRDKQLQAAGATSQATVDADQAKLEADQATLAKDQAAAAITQQQIAEMTITSPVDGIVAARDIEVGEQVSTSTTCFSIAQTSTLCSDGKRFRADISGVKPGAPPRSRRRTSGQRTFRARSPMSARHWIRTATYPVKSRS